MEIFISTAWIRNDLKKLEGVLHYIDGIEINSIGNGNFSRELYSFTKQNGLKISSIHASAGPHKEQEDAYYLPYIADPDKTLREYDEKQLLLTAEWAKKINVNRIVVHAGSINDNLIREMYIDYKDQCINKSKNKNEIEKLKQAIINRRKELIPQYIDSLIKSIEKVCNFFPEINFYLETRVNYYEIPTPEEARDLFDYFNFKNLGYWNDIGHSYIQNELGLIDLNKWKANLNRYCGGLHIHDINGDLKDHYPPGFGNAPLQEILKGLPQNIPWVLEINSRHTQEELIKGIINYKKLLEKLFDK